MKNKCAVPKQLEYRGRFAPTPSGPLHLGSLVAAVGSYLDAKIHHGSWLVRIEDIDPPREVAGAADTILRQLEAHGLLWDGSIRYQSQQSSLYAYHLEQLIDAQAVYACDCTRKQIKARAPYYTGYCRHRNLPHAHHALRFVNDNAIGRYHDLHQGLVEADRAWAHEDFILKRRDGLWAYQLAVVSDDRDQGITDIVRGSDLMVPTLWQLSLWQRLNAEVGNVALPRMRHLPLLTDESGRKLSKQNHAPAIVSEQASANLTVAMGALGLAVPDDLRGASPETLLRWGVTAWAKHYPTSNDTHPNANPFEE